MVRITKEDYQTSRKTIPKLGIIDERSEYIALVYSYKILYRLHKKLVMRATALLRNLDKNGFNTTLMGRAVGFQQSCESLRIEMDNIKCRMNQTRLILKKS